VFDDPTKSVDFFNYTTMAGRYHLVTTNPGTCSENRLTTNFNSQKIVLINLRNMTIEKCLTQPAAGCGDGILS
jgi:hypothetical protein